MNLIFFFFLKKKITSPFQALRSVWQMEVKRILTRTSIFWGGSTRICSMTNGSPGPRATAAVKKQTNKQKCYVRRFAGREETERGGGGSILPLQMMTFPAVLPEQPLNGETTSICSFFSFRNVSVRVCFFFSWRILGMSSLYRLTWEV